VPDPRLRKLADLLCHYSLEVGPGALVQVQGPAHAQPLMVEMARAITEAGGFPWIRPTLESSHAILLEEGSDDQLRTVTALHELDVELPTHELTIWAPGNTRYLSRIAPERQAAYHSARRDLMLRFEERISSRDLRWCGVTYPTDGQAQEAGMALAEWEDFVYTAGHLDDDDPVAHWRAQSARQAAVAERLAGVRELRIVAPDTDLTVDVTGRTWLNADGHENFPDGEIFTSPVETATRGHISFTIPASYAGRDVEGVRLWFEEGQVVREEAAKNLDYLRQMLDMDPGARRLGEVAFGLNYDIQRPSRDTGLDEKIGGTFHAALGLAFTEAGGSNQSALHWDMICDLRDGGEAYADGEMVYRDGQFL
jgi:aminopeptidase